MSFSVEIKGLGGLFKKLERINAQVDIVMPLAITAGAEIFRDAANPNAPSPHVVVGDIEKTRKGLEISIGPDKAHWYHLYAETGTVAHAVTARKAPVLRAGPYGGEFFPYAVHHPGHAARPFLRPAFDENEDSARDAIGDILKKVLK